MSRSTAVPLIWYKFESLSTSKVQNFGSAGVSLDATLQNGASVISSESPTGSTCLNLYNTGSKLTNDPTGQYLSIPPFTFGGAFSCSCWFKIGNVQQWTSVYSFSLLNGAKSLSLCLSTNGQLVLRDYNHAENFLNTNGTNYCDNKWHHVVVVSTGSTLAIFIDYKEVKLSDKVAFDYPAIENVERMNNYIGSSAFIDAYATIQVDDFRLYTTSINDYDIQALYNYKKTPETKKEKKKWNTNTIILIVVIVVVIFVVAMLILRNHRSVITPPHSSTHNTRIVSR